MGMRSFIRQKPNDETTNRSRCDRKGNIVKKLQTLPAINDSFVNIEETFFFFFNHGCRSLVIDTGAWTSKFHCAQLVRMSFRHLDGCRSDVRHVRVSDFLLVQFVLRPRDDLHQVDQLRHGRFQMLHLQNSSVHFAGNLRNKKCQICV